MIRKALGATFLSATILIPFSASAQGVPGGVERGAREGERAVGPDGHHLDAGGVRVRIAELKRQFGFENSVNI